MVPAGVFVPLQELALVLQQKMTIIIMRKKSLNFIYKT